MTGSDRPDRRRSGGEGTIASVNISAGGVPKRPVGQAFVGSLGLEGDGHRSPSHGGPDKAVSLLAAEAIGRVVADGHAGFPGAFGENLTVRGIDWGALGPGDVLEIGDRLVLELTKPATPCQTIAHWFVDRRIARLSHGAHPEDARWYASVLLEGPVAAGMRVRHRPIAAARRATLLLDTIPEDPMADKTHAEPAGGAQATTREQLLEQHAEARRRRNAAPLGGPEWEAAVAEVGRIEVEIARLERALDPPRV